MVPAPAYFCQSAIFRESVKLKEHKSNVSVQVLAALTVIKILKF